MLHGIDEDNRETPENVEVKIKKLLLTQNLNSGDAVVKIDRAHRIGRREVGKTRPVVVRFSEYKTKEKILRNASNLKGSGKRISEQFCKATLDINNQLFKSCKLAKEKDPRIKRFWVNYRFAKIQFEENSKTIYRNFNSNDIASSPSWYNIKIY